MILWIVFIFGNSLQIADISSEHSSFIKDLINMILSYIPFVDIELNSFVIRKLAHMFEFFVLSMLCAKTLLVSNYFNKYDNKLRMLEIIFCFGVASIDETIQLFVPGRAVLFSDVLIDTSGAIIAMIILTVINKLKTKS